MPVSVETSRMVVMKWSSCIGCGMNVWPTTLPTLTVACLSLWSRYRWTSCSPTLDATRCGDGGLVARVVSRQAAQRCATADLHVAVIRERIHHRNRSLDATRCNDGGPGARAVSRQASQRRAAVVLHVAVVRARRHRRHDLPDGAGVAFRAARAAARLLLLLLLLRLGAALRWQEQREEPVCGSGGLPRAPIHLGCLPRRPCACGLDAGFRGETGVRESLAGLSGASKRASWPVTVRYAARAAAAAAAAKSESAQMGPSQSQSHNSTAPHF